MLMADGKQRPRVAPSSLRMGSMVGVPAKPGLPIAANGGVQSQAPSQIMKPWSTPIAYDAQGRQVKPQAPAAPQPAAIPGPTRPNVLTPSDPRDSSWGMDINEWLRQNAGQRDDLKLDGERDAQDHTVGQQRLERSRGESLLGETSNANRSGLLYSSVLGKRRGQVETDFNDRGADANSAFGRRNADRAAALNAIGTITADGAGGFKATGGAFDDYARIEQGGVDRAGERDRLRQPPVADEPDVPPPGPTPAAPAAPAGRGKPQNVVKNGRFYRVYNGGKTAADWVYIRPASGS